MAKGFYLHQIGKWCIHQFWIPYFPSANLKKIQTIKDINKPFLFAKFYTDQVDTLENRIDTKLISDYGV